MAKVAYSPIPPRLPGADLLHRFSGPHRGGETRSDTFHPKDLAVIAGLSSTEIPSTPRYLNCEQYTAVDCGLWTVAPQHKGFSLVDDTTSPGQEGFPSARAGEVLIYGELTDPDSLASLQVTFDPYYLDGEGGTGRLSWEAILSEGTFFDGVVDAKAKKFLIRSPEIHRPAYLSLSFGETSLMKDYLVFPGDSLKVLFRLQDNVTVFSGPDAQLYEAQYQLKRRKTAEDFSKPRKLVLGNPESVLDEHNHRELWEAQREVFGARLDLESLDAQSLDRLLDEVSEISKPTGSWGQAQLEGLDPASGELILLDYIATSYRPLLYTLYRFYYPAIPRFQSGGDQEAAIARIKKTLEELRTDTFGDAAKLVSAPWLEMETDRLSMVSLIEGRSFLDILNREYTGELAERLAVAFLNQNLRRYPDPASLIADYGRLVRTEPWAAKLASLKTATVPGEEIIDLNLQNLQGDSLKLKSLLGKPTLVYFYFSTCVHSAHYFDDLLFPFYQQTAKENGWQLIAVSADKNPGLWQNNVDEYSDPSIPTYRLLPDSKERWRSRYNIAGYPRTFLLDPSGTILSFGLSRESAQDFERDFRKVSDTYLSTIPPHKP